MANDLQIRIAMVGPLRENVLAALRRKLGAEIRVLAKAVLRRVVAQ